ncbi:amidohydrolase family protein [Ancylobacter sp. MQZ15Z-1]|uniref:Amidohydrolase family protein n=1 Tax=Ancylobacter mangrovi TaxID=2972472 RepID=A0A9X2T2U0_9HYPH|nr:amidohydrolase family protein [Ancylobacter mangrovi]MCS0496535.1 amidohydrolase family protein [Ancylobacter mangrovi]
MLSVLPELSPVILGVRHTAPSFGVPAGACDTHVHVFAPGTLFPFAAGRHYTPPPASVADLVAHQSALGLERVVIVQASPYGTDNACLLDALAQLGPQARGVAVLSGDVDEETLHALHDRGVRGVRLNVATGGGAVDRGDIARDLTATAERIAPMGWHLQIYAAMDLLAGLADEIAALPVTTVLDHFARPKPDGANIAHDARRILRLLERGTAYVKLSAPRRLADPDSPALARWARALIGANAERVLWGSDWPHPRAGASAGEIFYPEDDGLVLDRLAGWANGATTLRRILVDNPARLYGFT